MYNKRQLDAVMASITNTNELWDAYKEKHLNAMESLDMLSLTLAETLKSDQDLLGIMDGDLMDCYDNAIENLSNAVAMLRAYQSRLIQAEVKSRKAAL